MTFIKGCLANARLKTLVTGISGGVDSLTAALLAQRAINELRAETGDDSYRFIAVRLPYQVQHDEHDAQACLDVIKADEVHTVDIAPAVRALAAETKALKAARRPWWISSWVTSRRACAWWPSTPLPAPGAAW